MKEMGNPFTEDTNELLILDTKECCSSKCRRDGCRSRCQRQQPDPSSKHLKQKHLKEECQLFSKLFISCQSRECDFQEFFKHENQAFLASLSDNGKLLSCQKSQLVPLLEDKITLPDVLPGVEVIIINGLDLVNANPPRTSKTFEEYAMKKFASKIQSYSSRSLSRNQIKEIPETAFSSLVNLQGLVLSRNQIKEIPETAFSSLVNLQGLVLSRNQIKEIPETAFSSLVNLQGLFFLADSDVHKGD
ncbi:uncharacterized protein LOC130049767 [Ostrea edulis]|uniref:uncharacterized protein LOC130049767 n=1 Tax=Ostrea edulis TaxID=37623 RepID=UPI0024AEE63C|nr:uncharacterized protein LOC130049767 [Ostrea edulis]